MTPKKYHPSHGFLGNPRFIPSFPGYRLPRSRHAMPPAGTPAAAAWWTSPAANDPKLPSRLLKNMYHNGTLGKWNQRLETCATLTSRTQLPTSRPPALHTARPAARRASAGFPRSRHAPGEGRRASVDFTHETERQRSRAQPS